MNLVEFFFEHLFLVHICLMVYVVKPCSKGNERFLRCKKRIAICLELEVGVSVSLKTNSILERVRYKGIHNIIKLLHWELNP